MITPSTYRDLRLRFKVVPFQECTEQVEIVRLQEDGGREWGKCSTHEDYHFIYDNKAWIIPE